MVIPSIHSQKGLNMGDPMLKRVPTFGKITLCLLWYTVHLILSIWYYIVGVISSVESFLIGRGVFKRYKDLDVRKVKYLAVAIDSEEAFQIPKVLDLLRWIAAIGVKNVCLYDPQGVLKRGKDVLELWLKNESLCNVTTDDTISGQKINLEIVSSSDGKLAITNAANRLMKQHFSFHTEKPKLTESNMADALKETGYVEPDPDLMIVYGPARCNMGFPAWRIRYTEIVHMGSLNSMKFGALVKAMHRFTSVHQNYGK